MKPVLIAAALSAGFLLSGCETTIVDRGPVHHVGYYETGPRYHHDRPDYHRRPVVHVHETEVHRTVVHNDVHRVAPKKKVIVKKKVKNSHDSNDRDHRRDDRYNH